MKMGFYGINWKRYIKIFEMHDLSFNEEILLAVKVWNFSLFVGVGGGFSLQRGGVLPP